MSATLTFASSGLTAKTGTTVSATWTDLLSMFTAQAGNAAFSWAVASSNVGSSPRQITLKPKGGGAGRILLVQWDSAPGSNNSAILGGAPTTTVIYACYFPAGNTDSPANLTAASGTILGDDTGVTGAVMCGAQTALYATSVQCYYFDSAESILICFNNPGGATTYGIFVGGIAVDGNDAVVTGVMGLGTTPNTLTFGATTGFPLPFTTSTYTKGTSTAPVVHLYYNGAVKAFYIAYMPSAVWATQAPGAADILSDTGTTDVWFVPIPLISNTKGEGFVLKLRQLGLGTGTTGAFTIYNSTGPVVQARSIVSATAGSAAGYPWLTNFKI